MGGQRRTPPCTDGICASEKNEPMPFAAPQMSLDVITPRVVSEKAKDTYPIISLLGVTQKLIPMKIFTQRKASTDSLKNLMVSQIESDEDWIHYHIGVNRDIQTM